MRWDKKSFAHNLQKVASSESLIEILLSHGQDRGQSEYFCASEQFQKSTWIIFHPRDMREMRFTTIPSRKTSGLVPSSLRNARWVSRCAPMLPGRYFTDSGNLAVARNSHTVEVHASECVTCDQVRYFRANSLKNNIGMVPFSPFEHAVEVEI